MSWPALDPEIKILAGTDIDAVWERFEVFEALHHSMNICNPMTTHELDRAIDAMALFDGARVLDVACGYGEMLLRAADKAKIRGTGIDLSPWMVMTAHSEARIRAPEAELQWVLGEARNYQTSQRPDVAVCVGAEWVWHGLSGTIRALGERVAAGGLVVVGGARLHHDADPVQITRDYGVVETVDDVARMFEANNLRVIERVDPDDAGWDAYLQRTADAARVWAQAHPGQRSERWLDEQADWQAARDRDRSVIGWSLWVARA